MSNGMSELATLQERLRALVQAGDPSELARVLTELDLHDSDVADLLEAIGDHEDRLALVRMLPAEVASGALAEMEEGEHRAELLAALDPHEGAGLLHALADDDAVDLIGELEPDEQDRILDALPAEEAVELRDLLEYDEETAGGIMTADLVAIDGSLSARDAIGEVRRQGREVEDFYAVFVVDEQSRLLGTVPLDDLILAEPAQAVSELAVEVPVSIHPDMDQEEVGRLLSRYNLVSVPVVDDDDQLLGRITFDDVIDVLEAEQTEDILRLAGVPEEEEVRADWQDAVRTRLPWLALNLITVSMASSVVIFFGATLERFWYLAAIMPIVAALGGNSGTQALAVTVRRIALSDGPLERKSDAVNKELLVGMMNGVVLGLLAALMAWTGVVVSDGRIPAMLPAVVLFALWGNILLSGFAGAFIPTFLNRRGVDPAVASSVFLTTFTDLFGFLLLLGLASSLLL